MHSCLARKAFSAFLPEASWSWNVGVVGGRASHRLSDMLQTCSSRSTCPREAAALCPCPQPKPVPAWAQLPGRCSLRFGPITGGGGIYWETPVGQEEAAAAALTLQLPPPLSRSLTVSCYNMSFSFFLFWSCPFVPTFPDLKMFLFLSVGLLFQSLVHIQRWQCVSKCLRVSAKSLEKPSRLLGLKFLKYSCVSALGFSFSKSLLRQLCRELSQRFLKALVPSALRLEPVPPAVTRATSAPPHGCRLSLRRNGERGETAAACGFARERTWSAPSLSKKGSLQRALSPWWRWGSRRACQRRRFWNPSRSLGISASLYCWGEGI